jgi:hypothetical protein
MTTEVSWQTAYEEACKVIGDLTVKLRFTERELEIAQAELMLKEQQAGDPARG